MKILILTLFLYLTLIAGHGIWAATTTVTTNYPAPSGNYNFLNLNPQPTTNVSCTGSNNGLVFLNTTTNNIETCVNGQATSVSFPEGCFNQFCSFTTSGAVCSASSCASTCPNGYYEAQSGGHYISDTFQTASSSGPSTYYCVTSIVCCIGNAIAPT